VLPKKRTSTHPGEVLQAEFLKPWGISQSVLARHIGVQPFVINELVHGKWDISARMAAMLAQALKIKPAFWMGLQADHDMIAFLQTAEGKRIRAIPPITRDA